MMEGDDEASLSGYVVGSLRARKHSCIIESMLQHTYQLHEMHFAVIAMSLHPGENGACF